jgi:hypothetical protein
MPVAASSNAAAASESGAWASSGLPARRASRAASLAGTVASVGPSKYRSDFSAIRPMASSSRTLLNTRPATPVP